MHIVVSYIRVIVLLLIISSKIAYCKGLMMGKRIIKLSFHLILDKKYNFLSLKVLFRTKKWMKCSNFWYTQCLSIYKEGHGRFFPKKLLKVSFLVKIS